MNNIFEKVGNTPLVRINRLAKEEGAECEIVVKCEFFNPGGSVKDRIAKRMIEAAKAQSQLTDHAQKMTIIEPTSGNTGIGLAIASIINDYNTIICLPEKMSIEKINTLKALGAKIYRTPSEVASAHPDSHLNLARRLRDSLAPHAFIPDQYSNRNNPMAHYEGTAEEIWRDCGGHVDVVVIGAGTGGTISGVGRRLKELNPNVLIIGVDPIGSVLSVGRNKNNHQPAMLDKADMTENGQPAKVAYQLEGIGYDFIPDNMDLDIVDRWIKVSDRESFVMARRLIRREALLVGGSSGAAMAAALRLAKELQLGPDKRMVVIMPDSVRNYMSKFLSDDWMLIYGFADIKEAATEINYAMDEKCSQLGMGTKIPVLDVECQSKALLAHLGSPIVAIKEHGKLIGVVNINIVASKALRDGPSVYDQSLRRQMSKEFALVTRDTAAKEAAAYAATGYPVFLLTDLDSAIGDQTILLEPHHFISQLPQ